MTESATNLDWNDTVKYTRGDIYCGFHPEKLTKERVVVITSSVVSQPSLSAIFRDICMPATHYIELHNRQIEHQND